MNSKQLKERYNINQQWKNKCFEILSEGFECAPRGLPIREILGSQFIFSMNDPIVTLAAREQNFAFAFGEAHWILSGSNAVAGPLGITRWMKSYGKYSDDGVTMQGAYGPKFADQISWVVDQLAKDQDTRQAVINFWRDRPAPSKDIPCTLSQQYFIREGNLHVIATMRSNDLIWGTCYDTFTFSMMAKMVQTLLAQRGVHVGMGNMVLNAGSAHIYENMWEKANDWVFAYTMKDPKWEDFCLSQNQYPFDHDFSDREDLLDWLETSAEWFKAKR